MKLNIIKITTLAIFFLLLSEKVTITNIVFAVAVAFIIEKISDKNLFDRKYISLKVLSRWIKFIGVLFIEVVKANIQVAKITLSMNMDIEPHIVNYKSKLNDEMLLTILANVITLTPGTMTVDIKGNELLIHCLNKEYSESLNGMILEDMLCRIEGELVG